MDIHLPLDRSAPLRVQLERELRAAIRSGRLRADAKLPPSRVLADALEVSRGVVVEAYSQLVAEGYLIARPGDGTRIAPGLAQQPPASRAPAGRAPRIRYDLRSGLPDLSFFPRRVWQWLPDGFDEAKISDEAAARGVAVHTLHQFCAVTAHRPPALLLGYGQVSETAIARAVQELAYATGT